MQKLIRFIQRPPVIIVLSIVVTALVVTLLCFRLLGAFAVGTMTAFVNTFQPYVATGDTAKKAIESYIGINLDDASDFHYYFSQAPGESHSQMRFSISPHRVSEILAKSSLCFGTQLTPNPTLDFITPMPPLYLPTQSVSTAYPTPDYSWMTPPPSHQYAGNHCSNKPAIYHNIRIDQSDSRLWTVWIQGYKS